MAGDQDLGQRLRVLQFAAAGQAEDPAFLSAALQVRFPQSAKHYLEFAVFEGSGNCCQALF